MKQLEQQISLDSKRMPKKALVTMAVAAVISLTGASPAYALSFELAKEVSVDWDTVLSSSAAWRVASQDAELLQNINGDDGNRNFDKGLITNQVSILTEAGIRYRNFGAFVRGSAFYDGVYFDKNDNNSSTTHNGLSVSNNDFTDETKNHNGKRARLLDAFVFGNFDIGDRSLNVRVGKQVVSWGEGLFFPGISSGQSPFDGTKANVPGVEVKDVLLPVGQVFGQIDLTNNLSFSAYQQWEWVKTEFDAAGSYFSTSDILDEGGENLLAQVAPGVVMPVMGRTPNQDARDSGQWGVAFNYLAEEFNGTEFGFYYLNFHDKVPQFTMGTFVDVGGGMIIPTTYHLEYFEDIKLLGTSFATVVGVTNVSGEVSYRQDAPVINALGISVPTNTVQAQVSAIHVFGSTAFADEMSFAGEMGYNQVNGMDDQDLLFDKSGWGLSGTLTLQYLKVLPGAQLSVPISFSYKGDDTSAAGTLATDRISVGGLVTYQTNWRTEVKYTAYLGDAEDNARADRDFVSFNVKYSF